MPRIAQSEEEYLRALPDKIRRETEIDANGCWLSTGHIGSLGYVLYFHRSRQELAHRASYRAFKGPIPDGLTVDHLCGVRHCLNPDHLQAVPRGTNTMRGAGAPAINSRKTHCNAGHEYNEENTIYSISQRRYCRACGVSYRKKYYEQKKLSRPAKAAKGKK